MSPEELHRASLIDYDEESETVLDRVALKHNPIRNGVDRDTGMVTINKRLPGALKQLKSLSDSPLLQSFAVIASRLSPDFGFAIYEKFSYLKPPSDSPASKPLASPLVAPTKGGEEKEKELVRGEVEKELQAPDPKTSGFEAFQVAKQRLVDDFDAEVVQEFSR